ncbi:DUF58 domain-containing protein [uncultured Psychrobacillus sp.]|uniref:DUF58 domain-containing protein n=1 Tax=uncultured Psychrobacillus sp. TaxID=1551585 RepID=UPI0026248264|nr:DUF58 domain-containing protein [uncultured Psychrobacillus sp.]
MTWKRNDVNYKYIKIYRDILLISGVFLFIFDQHVLFVIIIFLLCFVLIQLLYFQKVGSGLTFVNEKKRVRLMKGTTSHFELTFKNKGMPIWNGTITIAFHDSVAPVRANNISSSGFFEVNVPFSIGYNKTVTIQVPIVGSRRGLSRFRGIDINIPHPLTEGSIILNYQPYILMDAMVYPTIYPIKEEFLPTRLKPGELELNSSLFVDPFFPIGTREYEQGDQFNHIHWKASARTQQLQTKIFTKVTNVSVLFLVNLADGYRMVHDFEEKIEWLASNVEACYKANVPFGFGLNIRASGKRPFVFVPLGSGDVHRLNALELLSILSVSNITIPFENIIKYIDSHEEMPVSVRVFSHNMEKYHSILTPWEQKANVTYLTEQEEGDYVK